MSLRPDLVLLCWHCHEPLEERDAETVRANPHMPEWMSKSATKVHGDCVDAHLDDEAADHDLV